MPADGTPPSTELALLRGEVTTGLARIEGDIKLVLQEQRQTGRRIETVESDIRRLDERQDVTERTTVTREEMTAAFAQIRADAAEQRAEDQKRADRRLTIANIAVAIVAALLGAGVAIVAIIVN